MEMMENPLGLPHSHSLRPPFSPPTFSLSERENKKIFRGPKGGPPEGIYYQYSISLFFDKPDFGIFSPYPPAYIINTVFPYF